MPVPHSGFLGHCVGYTNITEQILEILGTDPFYGDSAPSPNILKK